MKRLAGFALFLLVFLLITQNALAYGVETHAFLTDEVVKFYNQRYPNQKIIPELAPYLIDGSRHEDETLRYMNHFYDPVNNRGLADWPYYGASSKVWAEDDSNQNKLAYKILPNSIATILTADQYQKVDAFIRQTNFTWQKAVELYAHGESEKAFYAMGHIIHLLEDVSVPDHTRNDAHPPFDEGGSPYENWTHDFTRENPDWALAGRLLGKKPIGLNYLAEYFDAMANYSNNNFYSKDSISRYSFPEPDYFDGDSEDTFVYKKDKEFGDYKLLITNGTFNWAIIRDGELDSPEILSDYWHRLSVKAVQYSAGLINLFFQEAEQAKTAYELEKTQRPYLSTIINGISSIFGRGEARDIGDQIDQYKLAAVAPVGNAIPPASAKSFGEAKRNDDAEILRSTQDDNEVKNLAAETVNFCSYPTTKDIIRNGVTLNEVAWMGSVTDADNEWLELQNRHDAEMDISGWQILDKDEQIKIVIPSGTKLAPRGFYLLGRDGDKAVPAVAADLVYKSSGNGSPSLRNSDEGLRLFDNHCELKDEVIASPSWPAGHASDRRAMERGADLSWHSYFGAIEGGILGTPKRENSILNQITYNAQITSSGGGMTPSNSASESTNQNFPSNNSQSSNSEPPATNVPESNSGVNHLVISEIFYNAVGSDSGKEFVELYNPTGADVNLDNYSLQLQTGTDTPNSLVKIGSKPEDNKIIKAKGFFLVGLNGYTGTADAKRSASLTNSFSETILLNADSGEVDRASYSGAEAEGSSLERRAYAESCQSATGSGEYLGNGCDTDNVSDWEIRPTPNPQATGNLLEPRQTASVENFQITYNSRGLELNLSWTTSSVATTSYKIFDENNNLLAETSSTTFSIPTREIGREFKFSVAVQDAEGLTGTSTETSVSVPSYFSLVNFSREVATATTYTLNLKWNSYPFIPKDWVPDKWHAVIFYYNSEATSTNDLVWISQPTWEYRAWGLTVPRGLKIRYPNCIGGENLGSSLILPDSQKRCDPLAGNHASYALNWNQINSEGISLNVDAATFSTTTPIAGEDYITMAFYAYQPGYEPHNYGLRFVSADKTKYYLNEIISVPPPEPEPDLSTETSTTTPEISSTTPQE